MRDSTQQFTAMRGSGIQKLAYSTREAAEQVGLSPRQIQSYIQAGVLESFTIGRSRRITHQALVDFIDRMASKTAA
jgi:excisionase family DNA binding protein